MALPPREWSTQQSIPDGSRGTLWPNCLLKLQSRAPSVACNIACGPHSLRSGTDHTLKFGLVPSPIGSHIFLELSLYVAPKKATAEQLQRTKDERMYAIFSTYDPEGERYADRPVYDYTSKDNNNAPPAGPLSFSQQLKDVRCGRYGTDKAAEFSELLFSGKNAGDHLCFSWQSVRCHRFAFSRPLEGRDLQPSAVQAAHTFRQIIEHLVSGSQSTILVATSPLPVMSSVWWPWFAAIPAPVPESYWPWLHQPNNDPEEVMQFPANKSFERDSDYVNIALAAREKDWWKSLGPVTTLPSPLEIAHLDGVFWFHDPRQYLAYVLGAYEYEQLHSNKSVGPSFNGMHTCDVFPATASNDRPRYMVLLNIRQPSKPGEAEKAALPDVGERVNITITLGEVMQEWTGRVVRIPSEYAKYGRNVAVVAEAAPSLSGRVQAHSVAEANFFFGHFETVSCRLRESILSMMLSPQPTPSQIWMRTLLLGHDNHALPNDARIDALPPGFESHVDAVCTSRSLNKEQRQAVDHYFTHKVTIVRGPPGTGKSTLVDAILEIEERLGQKVWVCTESNAAVDILAAKVCKRKGTMQPVASFRIRPVFDETLTVERAGQDVTISALEDHPPLDGQTDVAQAIDVFLRSSRNVARAMSLEATIKSRIGLLPQLERRQTGSVYPSECSDLAELRDAYVARYGWKMEDGMEPGEFNVEEQRLEKKYLRKLRAVQVGYVGRAMLIFSTAAAASGMLFKGFAPSAMVMDEASQFLEARAVFPILEAMSKGRLRRILLIGDDKQLPPTLMAPRNPFHATGVVSLFERLIKTGVTPVTMLEQYRMHPDISKISDTLIYHVLRNGPATQTNDGVGKFRKFMAGFANISKVSFSPANAVVISPEQDAKLAWGSQRLSGSTSRVNLLTARMIMRLAHLLVQKGGFAMTDIMVIAFYSDQVALLEALFTSAGFEGIRVNTIDGSQGSEAPVVIVDCVTLGAAAEEGMGFLGEDQRRFNVAMTRAQVGRITIAHKDMVKVVNGKKVNSATWNEFFGQAKEANAVLSGRYLNLPTTEATLEAHFDETLRTYEALIRTVPVEHKNVVEQVGSQEVARRKLSELAFRVMTFIEATGATEANAVKWLSEAGGDLPVAINAYFSEHGSDLPVEDI
jgi:hypothetical protein